MTTHEKKNVFVFLGLSYHNQNDFFSSTIHLHAKLFFLIAEYYSILYMYISIIHSSVDGNLSGFYFLVIMCRARMNMNQQVSQ